MTQQERNRLRQLENERRAAYNQDRRGWFPVAKQLELDRLRELRHEEVLRNESDE